MDPTQDKPRWLRGSGRGPERFPCSLLRAQRRRSPAAVPAASPRPTRSTSPWPPGSRGQNHPGVPLAQAISPTQSAHRTRPTSTRFRAGQNLRDVITGSCRTPFRHARRTHAIW